MTSENPAASCAGKSGRCAAMMIFRRVLWRLGTFQRSSGKARLRALLVRDAAGCGWLALDELAVHYLYNH
jgi:hypothetical protein